MRPTGGARAGSTIDYLVDDVAVVISVALQHGVPAEALTRNVGRLGDHDEAGRYREIGPASIVGAALDLIAAEAAS